MPAGTCHQCGAAEVRCKGLCGRCYAYERRSGRARPVNRSTGRGGVYHLQPVTAEERSAERAWGHHRLIAALMAERPRPAREERSPWKARAACRDRRDLRWAERRVTLAMRAVCGSCPVRAECLAEALADPTIDGVWAATSPAERAGLRR